MPPISSGRQIAISLNKKDSLAWLNLHHCYKDIGRTDDATEALETYRTLMKGEQAEAVGQSTNPSNIPGGVSQTGKLADGGSLDIAAGTESVAP